MNEYFKNVARAMSDEEKTEVLKNVATEQLISELRDRLTKLENREASVKALFKEVM
jgi:hypothetical protein